MNRKSSSSPPKIGNSVFSQTSKRCWIFFIIFFAFVTLVFVFTFESNAFHHDQVRNEVIQNSETNNNFDYGSFISKIEFHDDDKKFLMNFLLKENIISRESDVHHGHHANDEETVFCLDLVSDANTHFRQLRNVNCENSLKSSLDLIRHHHDQENKKSALIVAKGNEEKNTDNIIIQKEFYDKASPEKDTIEFAPVSQSSTKKKLLNYEKFHSHSKNMKSQAVSNFVSPSRTTYAKSLVLALQKIETKSDHDDDALDDENHDSDVIAEKRKEVLEFSQAIDKLLVLNKTMMNGAGRRQYFSSAAYFASLSKIHFVFRISPSTTSPLSEGAVHALRDFMLNYDEQVLSHLVKYQKEHHSRVSTNFIFVGLDDENLVKEILKIFFSLIDDNFSLNNKNNDDENKQSFCRIVTSSNDGKNVKNKNRDVVVVNCGRSKKQLPSSKSKNKNNKKELQLFNEIDPSNFCHNNDDNNNDGKQIQLSSSALKFGTKTGVYLGKYSAVANNKVGDSNMMIVKHYNLLQYVHGFSGGLHNFLSSKISFQHPAIVMPLSACIIVTKDQEKESKSEAKIILPSSSLLITENVLQFQPFIKKQKSLTKFMEAVKKNVNNKKKATKNDNSDLLLLTWKDKLDISLQLLCIFSFLHSHPRGPFSFDDNHPDQYLIVENQKHNNSLGSYYYASNAKYLLKMVDIDTLQTAKKIIRGKNNHNNDDDDDVDDRIILPRIDDNGNDHDKRRQLESSHVLKCRCFYCRGRSNCLFVNSYEGYRSCGQFDGKDRGDEGNRENTKFLAEKLKWKKEKNKNKKKNDDDDGEIRECTLLTDSWYLGQLLFFVGSDGELLFPTHMSMKEVIEAIEAATKPKDSSPKDLDEYFPHLAGVLKNGDHSDAENQIRSIFFEVVRELLMKRIPPEVAAVQLLGKLQIGSLGLEDWCPNDHFITKDKKIKTEDFQGLRIV